MEGIESRGLGESMVVWTVIYIAPTLRMAERICEHLEAQGFLVKKRPASTVKPQFEILVLQTELDDVKEVLNEAIHASMS